jgi:hypothetical protein
LPITCTVLPLVGEEANKGKKLLIMENLKIQHNLKPVAFTLRAKRYMSNSLIFCIVFAFQLTSCAPNIVYRAQIGNAKVIVKHIKCPGADCTKIEAREKGRLTMDIMCGCNNGGITTGQEQVSSREVITAIIDSALVESFDVVYQLKGPGLIIPLTEYEKAIFLDLDSTKFSKIPDCKRLDFSKVIGFVQEQYLIPVEYKK